MRAANNQLPPQFNFINDLIRLTPTNISEINHITQLLQKVKFTFMCVKYKKQFRDWLWVKVRLPKTQHKYHPNNLIMLLNGIDDNDLDDFDNAINNW